MPFVEDAYQKVRCTAETPVIRLAAGQKSQETVTIRDESGNALDLSTFRQDDYSVMVGSSSSAAADSLRVRLSGASTFGASSPCFEIDGRIIDESAGTVEFTFTPEETNTVGMYVASVGVFYLTTLRHAQMMYVEFMPTTFDASVSGPITVPEVRMAMYDMCADANYLIDDLEFTDAEIIFCMRRAVDAFNETPPPVGNYSYANFPFRDGWLRGTAAFLLKMIAHKYRRNILRYSAGGVTVSDQEAQAQLYWKIGTEEEAKFRDWAQDKRVAININNGYGSIGPSAYGRGRYGRNY